jgi:hypothetical protein
VEKITHIADNDERGLLVGREADQRGVIHVPGQSEGLCGTHTRRDEVRDDDGGVPIDSNR